MNKREKQLERLREQNRNFTLGKPAMFTPLEKLCRKIRNATIFQIIRWNKSWPRRLRIFERAHRFHTLAFPNTPSPWLNQIALFTGAIAYLKAEAVSRKTGEPNDCDPLKYETQTLLAHS